MLVSRNFVRRGAPRNTAAGVVTYVKASIAGATKHNTIYTISIGYVKASIATATKHNTIYTISIESPKEKNRYLNKA